jgi:hypothetical protein
MVDIAKGQVLGAGYVVELVTEVAVRLYCVAEDVEKSSCGRQRQDDRQRRTDATRLQNSVDGLPAAGFSLS